MGAAGARAHPCRTKLTMSPLALPVILKLKPYKKLGALALGLFIAGTGIFMMFDDSGSTAGMRGWLVAGIGAVLASLTLLSLANRCPLLELTRDGIVYTRCLQGTLRLAWSELDRVEINRTSVPSSTGGWYKLDSVTLITTEGRKITLTALAPAEEMRAMIEQARSVAAAERRAG